jgi:hypothetical protein
LTAGFINSAYEIEFTDESFDAIFPVAPDPKQRLLTYENELMWEELLVYATIAKAAGFDWIDLPIPCSLSADTSHILIRWDFIFVEKYSGQPKDSLKDQLSTEDFESIHRQIGIPPTALQTIQKDTFGYFDGGLRHGAQNLMRGFQRFCPYATV